MKRLLTYVSLLLVSGMLLSASAQGRGRHNNNHTSTTSQSKPKPQTRPSAPSVRPGNSGNHGGNKRPDNNQGYRPGNGGNHGNNGNHGNRPGNNNNYRPGNNGNHDNNHGNRPGSNNNYRPGNNGNHGNHRPDNNHGYRPGNNHRPNHSYRPTPPPSHGHSHYRPAPRPPHRPYAPAYRHWARPVPPPSFRPYRGCPVISTIFGITLGATIDFSINSLINGGYNVAGYGNNIIYLNNVNQYNYMWPSAQLHYTNGALVGTELVYSSAAYDMSRYNMLYNSLVNQYGYPVSSQNNGGGVSVTWWGYNNGYVTLSFYGDYANNGSYRYYTTLSYGN